MAKVEGVGRHRAEKICMLYHGKQDTFKDESQNEVIYRQGI